MTIQAVQARLQPKVEGKKGREGGSGMGAALGQAAGAVGGAILGSAVPGGTLAGAAAGSALGGTIGGVAGGMVDPGQADTRQAIERRVAPSVALGGGGSEPKQQIERSIVAAQSLPPHQRRELMGPLTEGYSRILKGGAA